MYKLNMLVIISLETEEVKEDEKNVHLDGRSACKLFTCSFKENDT